MKSRQTARTAAERDREDYPRLTKLGIPIIRPKVGPPGVDESVLRRVFQQQGLWEAWCRWSAGSTRSVTGSYPWDVEDFLARRPNLD